MFLDQKRTELVADPKTVFDRLDSLHVGVGTGQIAVRRRLIDDREPDLLVGAGEEDGLHPLDRPASQSS